MRNELRFLSAKNSNTNLENFLSLNHTVATLD